MILLHRIGQRLNSNFNELSEILACDEPLSFDGIYEEVMWAADKLVGKDITLFFMGNYLGRDNRFDQGQPYGRYLDAYELQYVAKKLGAKLGYHSWSHPDLTQLSDAAVVKEITPPFPLDYFAYPHGRVDDRVARLVAQAGYKEAWAAGPHGDGTLYQRRRSYLNW